jgi:hypothetical protein
MVLSALYRLVGCDDTDLLLLNLDTRWCEWSVQALAVLLLLKDPVPTAYDVGWVPEQI